MSSGVYADSYDDQRLCTVESFDGDVCDFDGLVEVHFDPETDTEWWDCPLCDHEHVDAMQKWRDGDDQ